MTMRLALLVLAFCAAPSLADSSSINLSMPSAGSSSGSDSVKMGSNDCKNSISGATLFEVGMTGIVNNAVAPLIGKNDPNNPQTKDLALYARITIPLDAPRERINCNTLYQLMLQKERLEVQKLKQEIQLLKQMQQPDFEN
jgi:hypothetical protein|tara:strand:- start:34 stop:456 length:423 start_codon:yes stop_codon:yes gene_type:complete